MTGLKIYTNGRTKHNRIVSNFFFNLKNKFNYELKNKCKRNLLFTAFVKQYVSMY